MTTEALLGIDTRPDDASARARAEVEKLTELIRQYPDDAYYRMCLREWLKELANPTRYRGEERR